MLLDSESFPSSLAVYCAISIALAVPQLPHISNEPLSFDNASLPTAAHHLLQNATSTRIGTLVMLNLVIAASIATAITIKTCFLGNISSIEASRLTDRLIKFALLKTVFMAAIVNPKAADLVAYTAWTSTQGLLKGFVGLAADRAEALLSSPTSQTWQHARCAILMLCVGLCDAAWAACAARAATAPAAPVWAVLWLLDAACIGVEASHASLRYALQSLDQWKATRKNISNSDECRNNNNTPGGSNDNSSSNTSTSDADTAAEARSNFLYVLELCADLAVQVLRFAEAAHLMRVRGGPKMQLIDVALLFDMRCLVAGAWRRGQGHLAYRRLCYRLKNSFPDAKHNNNDNDCHNDCAICLENLTTGKQLPCGHAFHLRCLASWMRTRQSTAFSCPLCRANLLLEGDEEADGAGGGGRDSNHCHDGGHDIANAAANNDHLVGRGSAGGSRGSVGVASSSSIWNLRDFLFARGMPGAVHSRIVYSTGNTVTAAAAVVAADGGASVEQPEESLSEIQTEMETEVTMTASQPWFWRAASLDTRTAITRDQDDSIDVYCFMDSDEEQYWQQAAPTLYLPRNDDTGDDLGGVGDDVKQRSRSKARNTMFDQQRVGRRPVTRSMTSFR